MRKLIAIMLLVAGAALASTNYPTVRYVTLTVTNDASSYDLVGPTNITVDNILAAWGVTRTGTTAYVQAQVTSNAAAIATLEGQTGAYFWADGSVNASGDWDLDGHDVADAGAFLIGTNAASTLTGGQTTGFLTIRANRAGVMLVDTNADPAMTPGISFRKNQHVYSLEHNVDAGNRYLDVWYYDGATWVETFRIDATRGHINFMALRGTNVTCDAYGAAWNGSTCIPNLDRVYDAIEALDADLQAQVISNDTDIAVLNTGKLAVATNSPSPGKTLQTDGTHSYWGSAGSGDFMADGSVPATGDFALGGNSITDLLSLGIGPYTLGYEAGGLTVNGTVNSALGFIGDGENVTNLNGSAIVSGTVDEAWIDPDIARDAEVTAAISAALTNAVYIPYALTSAAAMQINPANGNWQQFRATNNVTLTMRNRPTTNDAATVRLDIRAGAYSIGVTSSNCLGASVLSTTNSTSQATSWLFDSPVGIKTWRVKQLWP